MATDTEVLPDIDTKVTEPDGMAHYVRIKAIIQGGVVVALCGKKYTPTMVAGAEKLPLCPKCDELMSILEMMSGESR